MGLIPLYATLVIDKDLLAVLPNFRKRMEWFCSHRADIVANHITHGPSSVLLSLVAPSQLPRILGGWRISPPPRVCCRLPPPPCVAAFPRPRSLQYHPPCA